MITHNTGELIQRIQAQTQSLAPDSPHLREAFDRIGLYVTAVAKLNVRRRGLIDTGRLINSLRYEFFREGKTQGVMIGSFNVPYAAVNEFGYRGAVNIPTHQRTVTQAFGRQIEQTVVTVGGHTRQMEIPPRPYLRPAILSSRMFIVDTLRAALQFAQGGR